MLQQQYGRVSRRYIVVREKNDLKEVGHSKVFSVP